MRILQVISAISPELGGPSQAVLDISKELSRLGNEVVILTTDFSSFGRLRVPLKRPVLVNGVVVVYFPVTFHNNYKFSFSLARAIKRYVSYFDVVHIHSLFQFASHIACYYCQKYRKPYILRPLGQLDPVLLKKSFLLKYLFLWLFEKRNLRQAALVHFTSRQEEVFSRGLAAESKKTVLPLGLDLGYFSHLPPYGSFRRRYHVLKGKKIILFLGRLNFKKGLDLLVKAFSQLAVKYNDVILVIAGPDTDGYANKIKKMVNEMRLSDRVIFTGMLIGLAKLAALRDCDVFVLPSYSENLGIAVVEAMACGKPVVISDKVGICNEVTMAQAGIVVPLNCQKLSKAIETLFLDQKKSQILGENAKVFVRDRYDIGKISKKLMEVYKKLI